MFKVPVAEHVPKVPRVTDRALAVLRRLDARDRRRILARIDELAELAQLARERPHSSPRRWAA